MMTLLRFIFSFVYTLAGISGCVAFNYFKNYPTCVLSVATAILNGVLSHIHFLNYKQKLSDWYTEQQLLQIASLGFYSFAFSTSALVYFSVTEYVRKTPILPVDSSLVIPIVWAFITLKSGLLLMYFGRTYSHCLGHRPLIDDAIEGSEERPNQEATNENVNN